MLLSEPRRKARIARSISRKKTAILDHWHNSKETSTCTVLGGLHQDLLLRIAALLSEFQPGLPDGDPFGPPMRDPGRERILASEQA